MRVVVSTLTALIAVLGLATGTAQAQSASSEDEQLLEPEQQAAPKKQPAQSRRDDELDDEELDEQVFYSGLGVSRAETEFFNIGEAINLEGVMGFRIPTLPWFGLELDIVQTIIPGENNPVAPGTPTSNCSPADELLGLCTSGGGEPASRDGDDFAMQALGISAAFKSPGRFYVTGKYGYRYIATSIQELDEDRSSNGFALGVGYRWGRGHSGVELVYKELAEDVDSIGLVFFVRSMRR